MNDFSYLLQIKENAKTGSININKFGLGIGKF